MSEDKKIWEMHFDNTDIIFVDPAYFVKDSKFWEENCEDFSENKSLDKLGCEQGVCCAVGDVYPEVLIDEDAGIVIGELCSDSYNLGCFRLEDVLRHNPDYADDMEKYPDSFLVISNFTGDVVFETKDERYYDHGMLPITTIIGRGSINFHSAFIDDDDSIKLHISECSMMDD